MFDRRSRIRQTIGNILALAGLLLMIASLIWLERIPREPHPAKTRVTQPPSAPKPFVTVVLDPGHGGQDSGAICGGVLEKDLTLDLARRIERLLEADGIATVMTRVGDSYVSLADRAALANRVRDSILISIHFNEDNRPVSTGVETYYAAHQITGGSFVASWLPFLWRALSQSPNFESQSLAGFIQEALVVRTRAIDRGTKASQFFIIANVTCPAVLVEGGFLTNKEDISKLTSEDYREEIAAAVNDGILRYRDALKQRQATIAATNREQR
jgi:N-acetylmuramoyl-L-alanine amidase